METKQKEYAQLGYINNWKLLFSRKQDKGGVG